MYAVVVKRKIEDEYGEYQTFNEIILFNSEEELVEWVEHNVTTPSFSRREVVSYIKYEELEVKTNVTVSPKTDVKQLYSELSYIGQTI